MNYPKHIYKTYKIIESDLHGEKHYALVAEKQWLCFKWQTMLKVVTGASSYCGFIHNWGTYWHPDKKFLENTIESLHSLAESRWAYNERSKR